MENDINIMLTMLVGSHDRHVECLTLLLNHKVKAFGIRNINAGCTGYLPKRLLFKFKLARYSNNIVFNFKSAVSYDLKLFFISHV
jgi:hypothetical protein